MIFYLTELPPPLSACFNNAAKRGRVKTARYKAWIAEQSLVLKKAMRNVDVPLPITGTIEVDYQMVRPDKRKRDLGNLEKGLSDLLVSVGILEDDSQIVDLRLRWSNNSDPVTIWLGKEL